MEWEVVIGLEIHVQLSTTTKIFSGASTAFGAEANTQACAVDLALPGTLPVFNENALRMAVMFGLAVNAEIGKRSVFERKNYFYPDLPKGYQTTQLAEPIVGPGFVDIETGVPLVRDITRGSEIWPDGVQRRVLPDLVMRTTVRSARTIRGFRSEQYGTVYNRDYGGYVDGRPGHHIGDGWFVAAGPDIPGRGALPKIHEFDLLATVHALVGQQMRPEMRGTPVPGLVRNDPAVED